MLDKDKVAVVLDYNTSLVAMVQVVAKTVVVFLVVVFVDIAVAVPSSLVVFVVDNNFVVAS